LIDFRRAFCRFIRHILAVAGGNISNLTRAADDRTGRALQREWKMPPAGVAGQEEPVKTVCFERKPIRAGRQGPLDPCFETNRDLEKTIIPAQAARQ
jgi:hypothetical protein